MHHNHLIAQGSVSNPPTDCEVIESWMGDLIQSLGMSPLISPKAAYCETIGNRGVTCISAIETSHIVLHVWDEAEVGSFQLDVYTCSNLDLEVVWSAIKVFQADNIQYKFYDRKSGFKLIGESE